MWGNNDVTTHTVTSDTAAFNSNNLNSGETFQVKFDNPGHVQVPLHHSLRS